MLTQGLERIETIAAAPLDRRALLKRAGLLGASLPFAGAILSACSSSDPTEPRIQNARNSGNATPEAVAVSTNQVTELTLTAADIKFEPTTLEAPVGGLVRLTFVNDGLLEHDWDAHGMPVEGLTAVSTPATFNPRMSGLFDEAVAQGYPYAAAGAGEQMVVEFTPTTPGTYEMMCMVPGHKEAGMTGTFSISGSADAAEPAATAHTDAHAVSAPAAATGSPYDAPRLPAPVIAEPVGRREPMELKEEIEVREIVGYVDEGVAYQFWTFDGTIPGRMLRCRVGDTVTLTLTNAAESLATHNIDLHAVTGPGGGAHATLVAPGEAKTFRFKAMNPGVYVYHCAVAPIPHHISSGMYGLIVVEPEEGLPPVDREFYVMQGDLYLEGARGEQGLRPFSMDKMLDERPDYVLFNGAVGALTEERALTANVGETVRIFFGVGGPNLVSSFHVIGEIFDRVYPQGASEVQTNVQTTLVPAGGATMVEFTVDVPGDYALVDHSLGRAGKGALGILHVEGDPNPEIFAEVTG
jgi:nitrite reductase (NO-forming)